MVFKKKRSGGKTKWYASYQDVPSGDWKQKCMGTDKRVAEQFEKLQATKFAQFEAGMYNPMSELADAPMETHLTDFERALAEGQVGGRGKPKIEHVEQTMQRLTLAITDMRSRRIADLSNEKMVVFLQKLRTGRVFASKKRVATARENEVQQPSPATCDDYGRCLKSFGAWLEDAGRVQRNPFSRFRRTKKKGRDETIVRRALSLDELTRLAEASPDNAVLYWVAATTGLRRGELMKLEWKDVHPSDKIPHITLSAKATKNSKPLILPLQKWVAEMLLEYGEDTSRFGAVFDMPFRTATMIRSDARRAGIELVDSDGRILDFHSLRSSTATILFGLGCRVDMIQKIMRHANIQTTLDHYHKTDLDGLAQEIQIPDPRRKRDPKDEEREA